MDTIVYTAGSVVDDGAVRVNNSLAIHFEQLGAAATLIVDGGLLSDTLVAEGTDGNDTFTVLNNGLRNALDITTGPLNRLDVQQTNIEALLLDGLNGDDSFTVNDNVAVYTGGIAIHGGNPSASDSLTLNGTRESSPT